MKSRTLIHFPLSPHSASMLLHDALHRGQTDSGPFEVLGAMQALEDPEQLVDVLHVETDAIVPDREYELPIALPVADPNDGRSAGPGKLERIRQQILKNLLH